MGTHFCPGKHYVKWKSRMSNLFIKKTSNFFKHSKLLLLESKSEVKMDFTKQSGFEGKGSGDGFSDCNLVSNQMMLCLSAYYFYPIEKNKNVGFVQIVKML